MNSVKQLTFEAVGRIARAAREEGRTVVFTNGCFDILHAGHITYLTRAGSMGDMLVVGLNSDRSVKMIKGEKRPVVEQDQRATVLGALECVDYIVVFDDPDPGRLIETVMPDVLVKGADWKADDIAGADFVKKTGGRVERIPFELRVSSTDIIKRIGRLFYEAP